MQFEWDREKAIIPPRISGHTEEQTMIERGRMCVHGKEV